VVGSDRTTWEVLVGSNRAVGEVPWGHIVMWRGVVG